MFAQSASRTPSVSIPNHIGVDSIGSVRSSPQPLKKTYSSSSVQDISGNGASLVNGATGTSMPANNSTPSRPQKPARRIEVEALMNDLRRALGHHWDHYREVVTGFLTGHLTRMELEQELSVMLDRGMVRMHNQFLLANLANALRDPPPSTSGLPSWNTRTKDAPNRVSNMGDPVVARLKSEIMGFTPRERRRLKAITRDAGKKGVIPSTIILTRQAKMQQIPNVKEREKAKTNINQGYQTPLATESFELPDADNLRSRVLAIAYENGLLDGISSDVPDIILAGLEYHLRDFLQQLLDRVRPQKHKKNSDTTFLSLATSLSSQNNGPKSPAAQDETKKTGPGIADGVADKKVSKRRLYDRDNIITAEDMALALELAPHSIVEPSAPLYRLWDVMLKDEIDDLAT